MRRTPFMTSALLGALVALASSGALAQGTAQKPAARAVKEASGPMYKPSSYSKAPSDISTDAYGAFQFAPNAPHVGDTLADFSLPATTGTFRLEDARKKGEVIIIFYRGDW